MTKTGRSGGVEQNKRSLFILRRATWFGSVTTRDIREAFGVARQQASIDLDQAVQRWVRSSPSGAIPILRRGSRQVIPDSYPISIHDEASVWKMMRLLSCNAGFQETGLRDSECQVIFPDRRRDLIDSDIMAKVMQAVIDRTANSLHRRILEIEYVGLKEGDTYRTRKVIPIGLEFDGAQTRMRAQDLDAAGYPIKSFTIARIRSAKNSFERLPADFREQVLPTSKRVRFRLTLDPRLTDDQKDALARELGMTPNGVVEVGATYAHPFMRFYTNGVPPETSQSIIWPPVIFCEKV